MTTANRWSLAIIAAMAIAWLAVAMLEEAGPGPGAVGGPGALLDSALRYLAGRWKLARLEPEAQWHEVLAVVRSFILAVGVGWLLALRDGVVGWIMGPVAYARLGGSHRLQIACAVLLSLVLLAHLATGLFHDYGAHARQWSAVLGGLDPWRDPTAGHNTYGPFFNLFAVAFAFGPLWPLTLFVYLWFGCWLFIMGRLLDPPKHTVEQALAVSLLFLMGPYFWVQLGYYGHFDIVPAAAALFALHLTISGRSLAGGAILGLGVLAKFYPLFVLPFLVVRRRAVDWRPALGCAIVVAVGAGIAFALWGESTLDPVLEAAGRQTRHLSILRFGEGRIVDALIGDGLVLRPLGVPLAAAAGIALFAYYLWKNIDSVTGAALAPVVVLLFYPLAHHQFFAICFLLIAYWYATDRRGLFDAPGPRRAVVLYLGWVTVFATLYYLADGHMRRDPARWVRDFAGLPAFLLGVNLVWTALRRATAARPREDAP